jgi:hypothetical protein
MKAIKCEEKTLQFTVKKVIVDEKGKLQFMVWNKNHFVCNGELYVRTGIGNIYKCADSNFGETTSITIEQYYQALNEVLEKLSA